MSSWLPRWFRKSAPPLPPEQTNTARLGSMLKTDLTAYCVDPVDKVMREPTKALGYTVAIKLISLLIAAVFPFIGYAAIGLSIGLIDRIIILNRGEFATRVISSISIDCIQDLFRMILGGDRRNSLPAPAP